MIADLPVISDSTNTHEKDGRSNKLVYEASNIG